jgi:hypothetical protein
MCGSLGLCSAARYNEMRIAQAKSEAETPEYRSRAARLTKWRELVVQAQRDLELPAAAPERIMFLGFCQWVALCMLSLLDDCIYIYIYIINIYI